MFALSEQDSSQTQSKNSPSQVPLREVSESAAPEVRRGVSPEILLFQIQNTAPFLFERFKTPWPELSRPALDYLQTIRKTHLQDSGKELSHYEYFKLCLSAHYATCSTFVPTDVDNQIRFKLWHPALETSVMVQMADLVLESLKWDVRPVSARFVLSPKSGEILTGHQGEWFSTAVAAYAALRRRAPEKSAEVLEAILAEMSREAQVYGDLVQAKDGVGALKAATLIAHNLGDLDRVMDAWNLGPEDALRTAAEKAGHDRGQRFGGRLLSAGHLNKEYMAIENHRHFALRAPKCLRKSTDLLLPLAPFLDDWGRKVAKHPALSPEEVGEIVQALIFGWERLHGTVGYARALAGIVEAFPGGVNALSDYLPAKASRNLKAGLLRSLVSVSKGRFEDQWTQKALNFVATRASFT